MLPKKIYVYEIVDGKENYLAAMKSLEEIPEDQSGEWIGVYQLTEQKRLKVIREL